MDWIIFEAVSVLMENTGCRVSIRWRTGLCDLVSCLLKSDRRISDEVHTTETKARRMRMQSAESNTSRTAVDLHKRNGLITASFSFGITLRSCSCLSGDVRDSSALSSLMYSFPHNTRRLYSIQMTFHSTADRISAWGSPCSPRR